MCDETETVSHLFLLCNFAQQIWFWMGTCQQYYIYWNKFSDIMAFAATLSGNMHKCFLVVLSSVCWSLWKHRNLMVFEKVAASSVRNQVLLIIFMVHYWTWHCKDVIKRGVQVWLPEDLDLIPLQVVGPALALAHGSVLS
jgi:hypothetical protein